MTFYLKDYQVTEIIEENKLVGYTVNDVINSKVVRFLDHNSVSGITKYIKARDNSALGALLNTKH